MVNTLSRGSRGSRGSRIARDSSIARGSSIFVFVLTLGLTLAASCAAPRVLEDSAAACSNGADEDGDGQVDCADPDCTGTSACEATAATCSDGIDNDQDGYADCQEEGCRTLGFCETFDSDCTVADQHGCPRGMGCYPGDGAQNVCTLEGPASEGEVCSDATPSRGCHSGLLCAGLCTRVCSTDDQCGRGTECFRGTTDPFGLCGITCAEWSPCAPGFSCIPVQRLGAIFAAEGWVHVCIVDSDAPPAGTLKLGATCNENQTGAIPAPSQVCMPGLLCVPEGEAGVCRQTCPADPSGESAPKCASGRCIAVDPFDQRPPRVGDSMAMGVCVP